MTTVLITGAGRGIGLEFAKRFVDAGATVHGTVRDMAKAEALTALGDGVSIHRCDVTSDADVTALADAFSETPIDILINNAGVFLGRGDTVSTIDLAAFEETLRVNTIAPIRVVRDMAGQVAKSDRKLIVNVSSRMGSIGEGGAGAYAYRTSKAALNMAMVTMSRDLAADGVTVIQVHPGWVQTDMGGSSAAITVLQSVDGLMNVIDRARPSDNGGFFNYDGSSIDW